MAENVTWLSLVCSRCVMSEFQVPMQSAPGYHQDRSGGTHWSSAVCPHRFPCKAHCLLFQWLSGSRDSCWDGATPRVSDPSLRIHVREFQPFSGVQLLSTSSTPCQSGKISRLGEDTNLPWLCPELPSSLWAPQIEFSYKIRLSENYLIKCRNGEGEYTG